MQLTGRSGVNKGFTIVELLVTIGVLIIMLSLSFVAVGGVVNKSYLDQNTQTLIGDLRGQQIKAMSGNGQSNTTASDYGIYFETNSYILFKGSSYDSGDSSNVVIDLEGLTTFSSLSLPSDQIVFSKNTGLSPAMISGQNTITLEDTQTNVSKTISINIFGVPNVQ